MTTTLSTKQTNQNSTNISRYLRNWPWFFILVMLGAATGLFLYKITPTEFQVESKILIKSDNNPLNSNITMENIIGKQSSNMSNQIEVLQSFTNYRKAIANLNWTTDWEKKGTLLNTKMYKDVPFDVIIPIDAQNIYNIDLNLEVLDTEKYILSVKDKGYFRGEKTKISFTQNGEFGKPFINDYFNFILYNNTKTSSGEYIFNFNNLDQLARSYLRRVEVEIPNLNSEVIKLQVIGNIPQKESDFLNELNNVFITLGIEEQAKKSENSVSFINEQLNKVKDSLSKSEEIFSDYRQKNKVMDLSQEANLIYQKLEDIESEKHETSLKLNYYENLKKYLNDSERIKQISSPSIAGIADDNLNSLLQRLMQLYSRREVLSFSVKENTPSYILLNKEIDITINSLDENLKNLISNTKSEIVAIDRRYSEIQSRLETLPQTEKELIGMQRNFELNNNMYNYLLKKKAEAELSQASTTPLVQIIDPALPQASEVVGPSLLKNLVIYIAIGFLIPFLFIFISENLNNKILSREEVETRTEISVIDGIISSKITNELPILENPRSGVTESFRSLRFSIKNFLGHPDRMVVSVNSMLPGEGKTFISSNLAIIFAMNNKKVLLIGADIRKPKLENLFFKNDIDEGLSDYLTGNVSISKIIYKTKVENMDLIPAGKVPEKPTELLENGMLEDLIDHCKELYDVIILDNAPISLVSDALTTSLYADLNLFVLRIKNSKRKLIRKIEEVVESNKIKNAGIIINDLPVNEYSKSYIKKGYGEYVS
ncbi:GumC family protein [Saccharicrinis sp. FJH54]|uniref:GumC family protein n=1 Tax=Saccharicrinis sp. FJH54 TaxID=3344665 RepID=UPI0035D52643